MEQNTLFDLIYAAPAQLQSAIIRERLGERGKAAASYKRVIELLLNCDPDLRSIRAEAERRLRGLGASGG